MKKSVTFFMPDGSEKKYYTEDLHEENGTLVEDIQMIPVDKATVEIYHDDLGMKDNVDTYVGIPFKYSEWPDHKV